MNSEPDSQYKDPTTGDKVAQEAIYRANIAQLSNSQNKPRYNLSSLAEQKEESVQK